MSTEYEKVVTEANTRIARAFEIPPALYASDMCPRCHVEENLESWGYCLKCEEEILATNDL
jgi:hypothetical protein